MDVTRVASPVSADALKDVRDVFSDLIRGLQPEQVEVAQQVVMGGQELQIQLGQGQARLPGVVHIWYLNKHRRLSKTLCLGLTVRDW